MTQAVMLDIETLGIRPESVILTLGAVKFDPFEPRKITTGLYLRIDVDEQITRGREVNEETVTWWGRQPDHIREEALGDSDRVSVEEMVRQLNKFLVAVDEIWCQGPSFDIVILENIYRQYQISPNWKYHQIRDSRTLFQVHGDPRDKNAAGLHNALEDCVSQASGVQKIYKDLGLRPR
jgi:inhibitor of KinA sporulation pathway (predicted exonuclease)